MPPVVRGQGCETASLAAVPGANGRPGVEGDYLVIVYNAESRETFWYDYNRRFPQLGNVVRNGSLLPVVYAKEKIAVRVCNLRFGDVLTITTNQIGLPESGADIRGVTPTTVIPTLGPTLDALQSQSATGSAAQIGGLGFSAPNSLTLAGVAGITAGTTNFDSSTGRPTNSAVGNIMLSPRQLALQTFGLEENARSLYDSVSANWHGTHEKISLPGSVEYLKDQSNALLKRVTIDATYRSDAALFDQDITRAQGLVLQLTNLSTALTAQQFGTRAVTLQTSYAAIQGAIDLIKRAKAKGLSIDACTVPPPQSGFKTTVDRTVVTEESDGKTTTTQTTTVTTNPDPKAKDKAALTTTCPNPGDIARRVSEQDAAANFYSDYQNELYQLCTEKQQQEVKYGAKKPFTCENPDKFEFGFLFEQLHFLSQDLQEIDQATGQLFTTINNWNEDSRVEQADLLQPVTGNALQRISIAVQRGFTPFVLASSPSVIGTTSPTLPQQASSASAPTATTSTLPHTVKTILVEVHRRANFNVAGGALVIHVPTSMFTSQLSPNAPVAITQTPSGATATYQGTCNGVTSPIPGSVAMTTYGTYYCITTAQKTEWQVSAMAAMVWYPFGRDYFPRKSGLSVNARDLLPSVLIGTSVTSLGNAVGAINFEPFSGINLFAGVGSAHATRLANGFSPNTPVGIFSAAPTAAPSPPTVTTLHVGFSAGIAFDLGVFAQIFKSGAGTAPAGLP